MNNSLVYEADRKGEKIFSLKDSKMSSAQTRRQRRRERERIAAMREEVATLKEQIASAKQREKSLQDTHERLQIVNQKLNDRLKFGKKNLSPAYEVCTYYLPNLLKRIIVY